MQYTHSCIKCSTSYTDTDPDAYYCATCNAERKAIAAQVDKRLNGKVHREVMSAIKAYDAAPKVRGFIRYQDL
jgi:hypothetical protein